MSPRRLAIAINADRLFNVEKELRPALARPATWIAVLAAVALAVTGFIVLQSGSGHQPRRH